MTTILPDGIANANALRAQFETESSISQETDKTAEGGESVIIVGAGAFGSSLAFELVTHYRDKYARDKPRKLTYY
jgi:NADH dehydrogenase FAD-containing subunit